MGTPEEHPRPWRGQYWRGQVQAALGIAALAGVGLAFLERDLGFILMASAAVAFPVWLVVESWLALGPQQLQVDMRSLWRNRLVFAVTVIVGAAVGMLSNNRTRSNLEGLLFLLPVLIGFAARALYVWRDAQVRPIGLLKASFARISYAGALAHFASYVIALAAGLAAAAQFEGWLLRAVAYACAAILAKLAADFVFTKPAPLDDRSLSAALVRLTVISPLWWGFPWGVLIAGHFFVGEDRQPWPILSVILDQLPIVYHVTIATVFVFAATTAVAFLRESRSDRAWASALSEEDGGLRPADWVRLYAGVLALALAAYAFVFTPFWRSDEDNFGVETWTCARVDKKWTLGWIAKEGIAIKVHGYIELFNISCVPRADGRGCEYDREGWDEIETVVQGKDGFLTTVTFNRKSEGVSTGYRHHGYLYGSLGNEFVLALSGGKSAEMKIKAPRGRLLYTVRMDLSGYDKSLKACRARWLEEAAER